MRLSRACLGIGLAVLLIAAEPTKLEWTTDPSKMVIPDQPAAGKILGVDFKPDAAKVDNVTLTLSQGKGAFPDVQVMIFHFLKPDESIEGKTWELGPKSKPGEPTRPHIHFKRIPTGKTLPEGPAIFDGYAMKLELGQAKDGKIPGKIYLCLPDKDKSIVAGTFMLEKK